MEQKETKHTQAVIMTESEMAEFRAFQAAEAHRRAEEKARQMREDYTDMVDREIASLMPELVSVSRNIAAAKRKVYENFRAIIELKEDIFRLRKDKNLDVKSHTFTTSKGDMHITLGAYTVDNYLDTADEGIAIVKEYISSLAKDEESKTLVDMVMKLLAKDAKGTLKASRIIQLRRLAEKSGNERFLEGVRIIEESYAPVPSKTYVRAELRGDNGEWKNIPLGMTES